MIFLSEPQMKAFIEKNFSGLIEQKYYDRAKTWPRVMVGYFQKNQIKLIKVPDLLKCKKIPINHAFSNQRGLCEL